MISCVSVCVRVCVCREAEVGRMIPVRMQPPLFVSVLFFPNVGGFFFPQEIAIIEKQHSPAGIFGGLIAPWNHFFPLGRLHQTFFLKDIRLWLATISFFLLFLNKKKIRIVSEMFRHV